MRIKLIGVNVAFKFRRALTALWLFAFSTWALAQTVGGTMTGAVAEPSGAVIPGVTVTITNIKNGTSRSILTNETGVYRAVSLQPGTYNVTADLPGFFDGSAAEHCCKCRQRNHSGVSAGYFRCHSDRRRSVRGRDRPGGFPP